VEQININKVCAECSAPFQSLKTTKKFCSAGCRKKNFDRGASARKIIRSEKVPFDQICLHCGNVFNTTRRNKFYCSESCKMAKYYERQYTKEQTQKIERICACSTCTKIISINIKNDDLNQVFCNQKCYEEYKQRISKIMKKININTLCDKCREKCKDV